MNLGKMPALEIPSLPGWDVPGVDSGGKERDLPQPFPGYEIFSPETFPQAEKASASSTELLPILQNPSPICPAKTDSSSPRPSCLLHTTTTSNALGWEQASRLISLGPCCPWRDHRLCKSREQTSCISVTSRASCAVPSTWELLYEAELNN